MCKDFCISHYTKTAQCLERFINITCFSAWMYAFFNADPGNNTLPYPRGTMGVIMLFARACVNVCTFFHMLICAELSVVVKEMFS